MLDNEEKSNLGLANTSYCEGPQTQGTGSRGSKMPLDNIKSSMRNS